MWLRASVGARRSGHHLGSVDACTPVDGVLWLANKRSASKAHISKQNLSDIARYGELLQGTICV